jgi:acid phosphatase class B
MKKLFLVIGLFLVIAANSQTISSIDTSFHPKLDSTIIGLAACQIQPIKTVLSNDTVSLVSIKVIEDNLQNMANLSFSFMTSKQNVIKSVPFTLQGQNYIDWNSNEYLFKLLATYIYEQYELKITFK